VVISFTVSLWVELYILSITGLHQGDIIYLWQLQVLISIRAIHLQNEVAEHSPLELTSTPGPSHPWYLSVPVNVSRLLHVQWPLWVTDKDCRVTAYHPNLRLSLISSAASTTGLSSHRAPDHTRHYRNLSLFACTAHIVASSGSRSPEPQELLGPAELLGPPESLGSLM
jgi:hypothetical protein